MKNLDSVRCGVRYAAVPLTLAALAGCSEGRTRRPNIIVMMTDDHTTQAMSCYGSLLVETPNLDRLAREGMLFENCYVSNAISGPSRACILTGKYSHVNRIHGQFAHFRRRPADLPETSARRRLPDGR